MEILTEKTEKELLKEIASGIYRDHYLIYNRKSTDEPNNQKNSIKYQKSENARFAFRQNLPIASISLKGFCLDGIISEKHSGFKEHSELIFGKEGTVQYRIERPKFYRLVQFLSKGYFKGVIVLCWDRASRNKGDNTIIEKLMKQRVEFLFTLATYDKTSSGALHRDIDGMFAEHHSRVTSEKVSLTIKNNKSKGICVYKAPVGYLNPGTMEHKPFDPHRAPIVKKLFETYATGNWSLADLARWANEHGLTMPPSRRPRTEEELLAEEEDELLLELHPVCRPLTISGIHYILTNPFYTGKVIGNDRMYVPSVSHKALVSNKLFDTVQFMLNTKKVSVHYVDKLDSPYRGLVRCDYCGRIYTPYEKKGIMYYGARCKKECPNTRKNFNKSFLESEAGKYINKLVFTENELIELDARTHTDIALFEINRHKDLESIDRRKRKIREDISYLRNNKLTLLKAGVYSPESYLEEEQKLNVELTKMQNEEQASDVSMHEVIKEVIKLSELFKTLCFCYETSISSEKEKIIRYVFSELSISDNTLKFKCRIGLQPLENRFISEGDPTTWISELSGSLDSINNSIQEIELLVKAR